MSTRCTTHFHACDCREDSFRELEADNKYQSELIVEMGAIFAENEKLKSLLYLTDDVVSSIEMNDLTRIQIAEFERFMEIEETEAQNDTAK